MKKTYSIATATILGLAATASVQAANYGGVSWTPYGADNGPGVIITYNGGSSFSVSTTGQGPYDGIEDTYVGVINASSTYTLSSINLSATTDIFGFDGDGIDTYGAPGNGSDNTGYGGPDSYFTGINGAATAGTVNFVTPLAPGQSTFFSLEEALSSAGGTGAPGGGFGVAPDAGSSMVLLGGALAGIGALRRRMK